ncbi:hypothetical protein BDF14DRAFT_1788866 [Spinellus fusiger]|nr:hypothetical protein BDF14DRAFT_1788866 [Spinellus fusiger]
MSNMEAICPCHQINPQDAIDALAIEEANKSKPEAPVNPHYPVPSVPTLSIEEVAQTALDMSIKALENPYKFKKTIRRVAVIGTGPSGLASINALKEQGLEVRAFERNDRVGGVWAFSETPSLKPEMPTKSLAPGPSKVSQVNELQEEEIELTEEIEKSLLKRHSPSACYYDLFTNTPYSVNHHYGYHDKSSKQGYMMHYELQQYYNNYAKDMSIDSLIEFCTNVEHVYKTKDSDESDIWKLVLCKSERNGDRVKIKRWSESFDAVVYATGIHQNPKVPDFDSLKEFDTKWPDKSIHSKQYRRPETYKDLNVLIVGGNVSATDVARQLDGIANNVYVSYRGPHVLESGILNLLRSGMPKTTTVLPLVKSFSNINGEVDGSITFSDGTVLSDIDKVIFCTGFTSDYSSLEKLTVETHDEYKQNGHESLEEPVTDGQFVLNSFYKIFLIPDPTLAFVGAPNHLVTIPFFEYQAKFLSRVWSGKALLPTKEDMYSYTREEKPVCYPLDVSFDSETLRCEAMTVWANYHAKELKNDELPPITNHQKHSKHVWDKVLPTYRSDLDEMAAKIKEAKMTQSSE